VGVLLVVTLLAWASARAWRARLAATARTPTKLPVPEVTRREASPAGKPAEPAPAKKADRPAVIARPAAEPAQVPERKEQPAPAAAPRPPDPDPTASLPRAYEEEDEAEFTLVTALPASLRRPDAGASPPGGAPDPRPAKVEVIYEDEADIEEVGYPATRILLSAEGQSDGGRVRRRNEDSFLVVQERSLYVVADGMGGYVGGDVASALAVDTVASAFETNTFEGKTEAAETIPRRGREMACAIQMANHAILARVAKEPALAQMGTTIVAARFSPNKQRVYIGHVGDSRCYRLRGNTMKQLTTDHTFLGLGLKGEGAQHLYQAIGIDRRITIDIVVDKPRPGDRYLLCTDGLTKMATADQIRDVLLAEPDLETAVYGLIELANDKGGKDNVTVILVKVLERRASSARLLAADGAD
jgi:serine/threonine protein phosphatase PrpC